MPHRCVELAKAVRTITDPMAVMRRIVDEVLVLVPGAEGAVVELASGGELVLACAVGSFADHVGERLRVEDSFAGLALRGRKALTCEDAATDGRIDPDVARRMGIASTICVPLHRGREPVGVLAVSASRPQAFDVGAVATLSMLAEFISWAIGAASDLARITAGLLSFETRPDRLAAADLTGRARLGHEVVNRDAVSEFVARVLAPEIAADEQIRRRIEHVLGETQFTTVFQPIVDLRSGELVGVEAMTRFRGPPEQPPDMWFDEAHQVGLGVELELAALRAALRMINHLPAQAFLAINIGPEAITSNELPALIQSAGGERIVLELTEHRPVADYAGVQRALLEIRATGARLAVDDMGAGFASLAHILKLAPEMIKLDRDITRNIDRDPVRRGLARALVSFAADTGAEVIAEGIETAAELDTVRELDLWCGQGYLLGRPRPLAPRGRTSLPQPRAPNRVDPPPEILVPVQTPAKASSRLTVSEP